MADDDQAANSADADADLVAFPQPGSPQTSPIWVRRPRRHHRIILRASVPKLKHVADAIFSKPTRRRLTDAAAKGLEQTYRLRFTHGPKTSE